MKLSQEVLLYYNTFSDGEPLEVASDKLIVHVHSTLIYLYFMPSTEVGESLGP